MNTEIYAFTENHSALMLLLYGFLILFGLGMVIYGLFFMPNKYCEFDGRPARVKGLPLGFRIMMQGFPVLVGIACIAAGTANGVNSGKYYYGWHKSEVLVTEGTVEDVHVQTREDGTADIRFCVEGEEFTLKFDEDLAKRFEELTVLSVQYGRYKDENLIYYLHTAP